MSRARKWLSSFARAMRRRQQIYGINRRNAELVYAHNQRFDYPIGV